MAADPLSPIAPARVRALLLPIGKIKRSRFAAFSSLLQQESIIRLGDVSPDSSPHRTMFSPLALPNGSVIYELSAALPSASQTTLAPFELFRQPLMIIGIADGSEYISKMVSSGAKSAGDSGQADEAKSGAHRDSGLQGCVDTLRDQFPKALVHTLMLFESILEQLPSWCPQETRMIPPMERLKVTTIKTLMCDLTSLLLAEMTSLAKSFQALPTIASPATSQKGHQSGSSDLWSGEHSVSQGWRNSQLRSDSRPSTPVTDPQNHHSRMSMAAQANSPASQLGNPMVKPRPNSPASGAGTPPAASTEDEMGQGIKRASKAIGGDLSRFSGTGSLRESSQDRISIQGFGSGSVNERARNKGKSRVGIVIGSLYLHAGRWQDALRELVDNTTKARSYSDHLWHAKGLENILVCLLLMAWAGIDFQIPTICNPFTDSSISSKPVQYPSPDSIEQSSAESGNAPKNVARIRGLTALLPDMVNMILAVYSRNALDGDEHVSQVCFSECAIRLSKLLTVVNLSGGVLSQDALQSIVRGAAIQGPSGRSLARPTISPTRTEIAGLVFKAVPISPEAAQISAVDHTFILAGVASILSMLGLQRKKAVVMKEMIVSVIPALIQARKLGAAEAGVHPAAGLAALSAANGGPGTGSSTLREGPAATDLSMLLSVFVQMYGISEKRSSRPSMQSMNDRNQTTTEMQKEEDGNNDNYVQSNLAGLTLRDFGNLNVKLDVLRMCINLCEAMPDFHGVLHFTALLLGVAGPGSAAGSNTKDFFVSLAKEEQVRLATIIYRTVGAAKQLGLANVLTDYWDEFLVRRVQIVDAPQHRQLLEQRNIQSGVNKDKQTVSSKSPFIHDASLRQSETGPNARVLVAQEEFEFLVTLQNPYDFDLEMESLSLASSGVELISSTKALYLGPSRNQQISITAVPQAAGELTVTGCTVKIKGCHEREFPIFSSPWLPDHDVKIKAIGLDGTRPESLALADRSEASPYPHSETITLKVIEEQPVMVVTNITLPQSAVMVLEGETKTFSITLRNVSGTCPVDFISVSLHDSTSKAVQAALSKKDLSSAELYELETRTMTEPPLKWRRIADSESLEVGPGSSAIFEIEVLGKPGLSEGLVTFNYAWLDTARTKPKDKILTRQISVPITVTVNSSIQLQRNELIAVPDDFVRLDGDLQQPLDNGSRNDEPSLQRLQVGVNVNEHSTVFRKRATEDSSEEHFLLVLDLRNAWPAPLAVSLMANKPHQEIQERSPEEQQERYVVREVIHPGHVARLVLLLPKVFVAHPHAPIPSIDPAKKRQFVVSASKISAETERASRQAFWHREELLKMVTGAWEEEGSGRHGRIDLRGIRIAPSMVQTMALRAVSIAMTVRAQKDDEQESVRQTGRSKFEAQPEQFLTLTTNLHNRSDTPIRPLLRLQPSLARVPQEIALDLDRYLFWTGLLQRPLPTLGPGESIAVDLGLCALCSGEFEIGATVEEIQAWQDTGQDQARGRSRAESSWERDKVLDGERRVWHASQPCSIIVRRAA